MRVCSTDAQRGYSRTARRAGGSPLGKFRIDEERAARKIDHRIWFLEMEAGGNLLVLECQRGLDQAGYASRGVQVADIRFKRTDCAEILALCGGAKRFG